ncbi:MAG TPA: TM0106 family RecB-like putative nuclease [Verrucomicrobiae bacterium]
MKITSILFEAFLKCPTKCWLRSQGETDAGNEYATWVKAQNETYRIEGVKRLTGDIAPGECVTSSPGTENLRTAKWRFALEFAAKLQDLESNIQVVERVPSEGRGKPATFIPIRFVFTNKLTRDDKLLAAFDALVLSEVRGRGVELAKIIHGDDYSTLKVRTSARANEVRKRIEGLRALSTASAPPDLILNRHCGECEFRDRCRQKAIEKDDLSLLAGMSEKERKELHSKGIFTITQLSYTFRPRRRPKRLRDKREKYHHSLKALAIREKKIHIVGKPELKIEGTPVYLDVEGLPDRDFYYLIGMRIGSGPTAVQHSLWADTAEDEGKIWREFLAILETVEKPVLIHYGSYETTFLKSMVEHYGMPPKASKIAAAVSSTVNILSRIYAQVYFATHSNGLKEIAGSLGFKWGANVTSGLHAIVWRNGFETRRDADAKAKVVNYNEHDCSALESAAEFLRLLPMGTSPNLNSAVVVDDLDVTNDLDRWGQRKFASEDFRLIADCAYFDYQRSRVYIRSNPEVGRANQLKSRRAAFRNRPNNVVALRAKRCWRCKTTNIAYDTNRWHRKLSLDLRISPGGIRRWITEFRTPFHRCLECELPILPRTYKSKPRYGRNLIAWLTYEHITNRLSFLHLELTLRECFGIRLPFCRLFKLKHVAAKFYKPTYDQIMKNLTRGNLIHADETKMKLSEETGYVWVFASLVDVAYVYRPTREGDFLHEMLNGFCGVLVTDFYSAYDSLPCPQQKCLVHLMWDLNADLLKQPFDDDLKFITAEFGHLARTIVGTIDRFGLKARFLRKHEHEVTRFCKSLGGRKMVSEIAKHYRERILKHRHKLFTFLEHDGVPWNNNNAEHAIKPIAKYRPMVRRTMNRRGIQSYLILLSIYQTCEYRGLSFLDFLLSGQRDINAFAESKGRRRRRRPTVMGTPENGPTEADAERPF